MSVANAINFRELAGERPPPPRARLTPEQQAAIRDINTLLSSHWTVTDAQTYNTRRQAGTRAEWLIRTLVRMELRERWELRQRTWFENSGYRWAVEYIGGQHDRASTPNDADR